jgi:phage shock protein C
MAEEVKKLYRSRSDKMIFGVCGGLAKYFNVDPVFVRLITVLLCLANGIGLLGYIILAIITPEEPLAPTEPNQTEEESVIEADFVEKKTDSEQKS